MMHRDQRRLERRRVIQHREGLKRFEVQAQLGKHVGISSRSN